MSSLRENIWVIVPAAGTGQRMQSAIPKQYLTVHDQTVIEHTLAVLSQLPIQKIVVAIDKNDETFQKILEKNNIDQKLIQVVEGGQERCHSVLNGLNALADTAQKDDWVLVHDAARPCIQVATIFKLIEQLNNSHLASNSSGGIIAVPANDTLKQVENGVIANTLNRDKVWQAQTPQMFRYDILHSSLQQALNNSQSVTDEAMAVELAGYDVQICEGGRDNIKITRPEDLQLAEMIFQRRAESKNSQEKN